MLIKFGQGEPAHRPASCRCAVDASVVDENEMPIPGQSNITFEGISTLDHSKFIGLPSVLRFGVARATMRHH